MKNKAQKNHVKMCVTCNREVFVVYGTGAQGQEFIFFGGGGVCFRSTQRKTEILQVRFVFYDHSETLPQSGGFACSCAFDSHGDSQSTKIEMPIAECHGLVTGPIFMGAFRSCVRRNCATGDRVKPFFETTFLKKDVPVSFNKLVRNMRTYKGSRKPCVEEYSGKLDDHLG